MLKSTLALLFFTNILTAVADTTTGSVLHVSDGDTMTMLISNRKKIIRLANIDAPELDQPFGNIARLKLKSLIEGRTVTITEHTTDKWGRVIGTVYLETRDINLEMISAGLAWHYKLFNRSQRLVDRMTYESSEKSARKSRVGLWSDIDAVRPSDWRREKSDYTIK